MKVSEFIKRYQFYWWVGLAFAALWILHDIIDNPAETWRRSINEIWRAFYLTIVNLLLFEFSIPYIRRNWKKVFLPFLLIIAHLFLYTYGLYIWRAIGLASHIYWPFKNYPSTGHIIAEQFSGSLLSLFFFGIGKHIYNHIQLRQATQQLRIEKQAAELNYLKSQTNPHFLFNTLNNIYSLARDKSDLAPESILRLSKILRFMLYEAGGEYISIEKEIKIIARLYCLGKTTL